MKIAMVGSRQFNNILFIEREIDELYNVYKNELIIVSGGQKKGADGLVKDICLKKNIHYVEFPPIHYPWNKYCIKDANYYNKEYDVKNFFKRNIEIAKYCDRLIAFIPQGWRLEQSNRTKHVVNEAVKLDKQIKIIEG